MKAIGQLLALPRSLSAINDFLTSKEVGADYGVGFKDKLALLYRFYCNIGRINTVSDLREHVELSAAILRTPKATPGVVVEAGCFMGGSTTNLSLVCALTGRKLIVFDSFQGLPEPKEYDRWRHSVGDGHTDVYYKGRFAAAQEIVEQNVARFGRIDVCEFRAGFYDKTMPGFSEPVVMAFFDGDLIDSLKPCLLGLWPNLAPGSRLYTHEAKNLSFIAIYFDQAWWRENLGTDAPGFVGSGVGLPLGVSTRWGSDIGYAQKPGQAPETDPTRDPAVLEGALFDWERADYAERLKD